MFWRMSRVRTAAVTVVAFVGIGVAGVASAYAIPGRHPQIRKVCSVLDPEPRHVSGRTGKASKHTGAARKRGRGGVIGEVADHSCLAHGRHGEGADADPVTPGGPPATR